MPVTVAKTAGFCFGVSRAVDTVYQQLAEGKKLYTLGEIIHNPQVTAELKSKGADVAESIADMTEQRPVIIRSHGVPRSVYEELSAAGLPYVDATCPYVKKIQTIVSEVGADTGVLIAGNPTHPEVLGMTATLVFSWSLSEQEDILNCIQ